MRLLKLAPALLYLCVLPAFSEDDHDHEHEHHEGEEHHHEEESNLMEQLGFGLVTIEEQRIANLDVTALPLSAVFYEQGKTFVVARDENEPHHFSKWIVELGQANDRFIEARTGVFPGDQVIVKHSPLQPFQNGSNQAVVAAGKTPPATGINSTKNFGVQIGAFSRAENARTIAAKLKEQFGRTDVLHSESNGKSLYRVRVGQYPTLTSAKDTREKLIATGFTGAFVVAYN